MKKVKVRRRPFLTKKHKENRLEFSLNGIQNNVHWDIVIWTDEKKFRMDGPNAYDQYWIDLAEEDQNDMLSHDYQRYKGVIVWMDILSKGVLHFESVVGAITAENYHDIIFNRAIYKITKYHQNNFWFQKDNAIPHKAKTYNRKIQRRKIQSFKLTFIFSRLVPYGKCLATTYISYVYRKNTFDTEVDLWNTIKKEIIALTKEVLFPFIESVPKRLFTLLKKYK